MQIHDNRCMFCLLSDVEDSRDNIIYLLEWFHSRSKVLNKLVNIFSIHEQSNHEMLKQSAAKSTKFNFKTLSFWKSVM